MRLESVLYKISLVCIKQAKDLYRIAVLHLEFVELENDCCPKKRRGGYIGV